MTGASKGIGKAIAAGMAELGATVVVSSRKQEAVDEVAAEFRGARLAGERDGGQCGLCRSGARIGG